jgi:membrane protease YdiL (CAAX protease family)
MQRITGFIFYGFIPLSIFYYIQSIGIQDYGINLFSPQRSLIWVGIFAPLIVLVNYFFSGKESNLRHYPQIRLKIWNSKDLMINFLTWLIYLFAYEAFFRGLLFFAIFHTLGVIAAIAINVLFYALAHLPKGRKETFASIPFGIVLCLITLDTGSFLAAFIIHGIMAISYEFFSIKAHPEMSITNKRI